MTPAPIRFVGRELERRALIELADQVVAGRGGAAWIEGEPGIGKSALLDEFLADISGCGVRVFRAAG